MKEAHQNQTNLSNNVNFRILFYLPNIIGYIRLILVFAAFYNISSSVTFLFLYCASIILDAFDGAAARKFDQTSLFGAWFDVVIDNIERGLLWTTLHPYFYMISAVEWLAFVCNHHLGPNWKKLLASRDSPSQDSGPPAIITWILANNFRNFWGVWCIAGLHVLPVWIFGIQRNVFSNHLDFLPSWVPLAGMIVLGSGRGICFVAELWSIWSHMCFLLKKNRPE